MGSDSGEGGLMLESSSWVSLLTDGPQLKRQCAPGGGLCFEKERATRTSKAGGVAFNPARSPAQQ